MIFKFESNNIIFIFRRSPNIEVIHKAIVIFGLSVMIKEENIVYALVVTDSAKNFSKCNLSSTSKRLAHLTFGRLMRLYWLQLPHFSANNNT